MTIKERYEKGFNPDEEYLGRDKEQAKIKTVLIHTDYKFIHDSKRFEGDDLMQ